MLSETPPLRIGIDARCLNTRHPRGMGKYVTEVISHIGRTENVSWRFFSDRPEEIFHKPKGNDGEIDLFDMKGYRFHTWEQIGLPWRAWRTGIQILHCTATTLPYWQPIPTVVTLHDTLPWKRPIAVPYERWYRNTLVPAAFRRCAAVITISESSRQDIVELWPWLEPKLHVIPHGVSDIYQSAESFSLSTQLEASLGGDSYFLYVGGAIERKRFAWAAEVFERLGSRNLKLAVCGFSDEERKKAQETLGPSLRARVCFLPYVSESDMPGLYQQAVGVLYPTLYEGFGLPALEAQAVGTPVLFSDLSSLRELKGPGAVVLPVDEIDVWTQACNRLLAQRALTPNPDKAARLWALQFSWSASANRHLRLYKSVMARKKTREE